MMLVEFPQGNHNSVEKQNQAVHLVPLLPCDSPPHSVSTLHPSRQVPYDTHPSLLALARESSARGGFLNYPSKKLRHRAGACLQTTVPLAWCHGSGAVSAPLSLSLGLPAETAGQQPSPLELFLEALREKTCIHNASMSAPCGRECGV